MMLIDCQTCPVRDVQCADCVVTALTLAPFGARDGGQADAVIDQTRDHTYDVPLDRTERRAVSVLIAAGLIHPDEANRARATVEPFESGRPQVVTGGRRAAV